MGKLMKREKYLLTLPALLVIGMVLLIPILSTILLSFFSYPMLRPDLGIEFVGLGNFTQLWMDAEFRNSLMKSIIFTAGAVSLELILGTAMALLLKGKVWGKQFFKVSFMIPMMMVPVVVGVAWRLFLLPQFTPLAQIFDFLHIPFDTSKLLTEPAWAMVSIIIADMWQWTPFVMILVLAALNGISNEVYEAAQIDGASSWIQLWHITIPLIKKSLFTIGILRGMDAMRTFDLVYILTGGGPGVATELVSIFNYKEAFSTYEIGYASAISTGLLMILTILILFILRLGKKEAR